MKSFEVVQRECQGLDAGALERWIGAELVAAHGGPGARKFQEIDVARIRLILQLRDEMDVEEHSLPVVLSLLDQLYDLRRRTGRMNQALAELSPELRAAVLARI